MTPRVRKYLILLLPLLLLTACPKPGAKTKDIVSSDGKFKITVPGGWTEEKDLNDSANLQAAHRPSQMFVVVLSETKEDLHDMKIEDHSKLTRDALTKGLEDVQVTGPFALRVDNNPAVQYEIRGSLDHVKIVYLHTTVESPHYFHQILAWTVPSRFADNQATLKAVTERFHEMP